MQEANDLATFWDAALAWYWAAETWLTTQGMSQQEAQAVMIEQLKRLLSVEPDLLLARG